MLATSRSTSLWSFRVFVQALHTKNLMSTSGFVLLIVKVCITVTCFTVRLWRLCLEWAKQQKNSVPSPDTPRFNVPVS